MMEDFAETNPVELKLSREGFKYLPVTGGIESDWLNEVMSIDPETKQPITDWSKYNKLKLERITQVPYDRERIKKISGIDKEWNELKGKEKYNFLSKLNPKIFNELIEAIKQVDEPDEVIKKKSSTL